MRKLFNNSATPVTIRYGHTAYEVGAYNYVEVEDGVLAYIQPPIIAYSVTEVSEGVDGTPTPVYGASPYPTIQDITDAWAECAESATPHIHLDGKCVAISHAWDVATVAPEDVVASQTAITDADGHVDDVVTGIADADTDIDSAVTNIASADSSVDTAVTKIGLVITAIGGYATSLSGYASSLEAIASIIEGDFGAQAASLNSIAGSLTTMATGLSTTQDGRLDDADTACDTAIAYLATADGNCGDAIAHLVTADADCTSALEDIDTVATALDVVLTESDLDSASEAEIDAFNAANGVDSVDYTSSVTAKRTAAKAKLAELLA